MNDVKILCIDDDISTLDALSVAIEYRNWTFLRATDVMKGLEAFKEHSPDIILIDYHMPIINGIEGVKLLRQLSEEIPIIVFTVDESQDVADKFLEVGASDFAVKPIRTPDLISRINLHLKLMTNKVGNSQERYTKKIGANTLRLIEDYMRANNKFLTAEKISEETGLSLQTVFRYLVYLSSTGAVEIDNVYGKVGRPKQYYKMLFPDV